MLKKDKLIKVNKEEVSISKIIENCKHSEWIPYKHPNGDINCGCCGILFYSKRHRIDLIKKQHEK